MELLIFDSTGKEIEVDEYCYFYICTETKPMLIGNIKTIDNTKVLVVAPNVKIVKTQSIGNEDEFEFVKEKSKRLTSVDIEEKIKEKNKTKPVDGGKTIDDKGK